MRRATADEECAGMVELLGADEVRRERYERRCFTVLTRRFSVIKNKSKILTTVWVFDVLPAVLTCTHLKEGESADSKGKKGTSPGMVASDFPAAINAERERVDWIDCIQHVLDRCSNKTKSYRLECPIGDEPEMEIEEKDAIAHELLDLAKAAKWGPLKTKLKEFPYLINYRPAVRTFAIIHQVSVV